MEHRDFNKLYLMRSNPYHQIRAVVCCGYVSNLASLEIGKALDYA